MPSGAKRRKAAKKKKDKQQTYVVQSSTDNNNNQNLSGAEEVKSQDERDSDGVETGSPVSMEQNSFKNENEDVEMKEEASVQILDGGNKSVEEGGSLDSQERREGDGEEVEVIGVMESKVGGWADESEDAEKKEEASVQSLDGENMYVEEVVSQDRKERRRGDGDEVEVTGVMESKAGRWEDENEDVEIKEEASVQSLEEEKKSVEEVGSVDNQARRRGEGDEVEVTGVMESKAGRWEDENEDAEKKEEASVHSLDEEKKSVEEVGSVDNQERRQVDGEVVEVIGTVKSKAGRWAVENEDAEKKEEGSVQSSDGENASGEKVGSLDNQKIRQADGEVVEVIGIIESKEGSESKDLGVVQAAKELYDDSTRFNDGEPQVAEKKLEEEHIATVSVLEKTPSDDSVETDSISKVSTDMTEEYIGQSQVAEKITEEENGAAISVPETAPSDGLVKSMDTISKEVTGVTEDLIDEFRITEKKPEEENGAVISVMETAASDGSVKSIDSISKEMTGVTEEYIDESLDAKNKSEEETSGANSISETAPSYGNVKSIDSISNEVTDAEKSTAGEANDSVLVTSPIVDFIQRADSSSKEVAGVQESAPVEDPSVYGSNDSDSKETRDNTLSKINGVSGDLETEDKVFPLSDANVQALSSKVVSEKENETALSSTAPQADTKGEDNGKETDIPECSKNQPFVSSVPPQTMAKTSWLSCCGLLDVFSGTSR